jgi:hypothetical protein
MRRVALVAALLAPLLIAVAPTAGAAECVPQQGVVQVHHQADGDHYQPSRLDDVGRLANLDLLGHAGQPPLVAAWSTCGDGGWAVTPEGHVYIGGDAGHFGDTKAMRLNQPIVGMSPTASGGGYWLVARDGGIFAFGDARFLGSTGAIHLNQPIVAMATTPTGRGYWLAAADGGLFTFGDAPFLGSMGDRPLNQPVVGMVSTSSGDGYWMVARDGGVFTFGDARFMGSTAASGSTVPIAGMIPTDAGYAVIDEEGTVTSFPGGAWADMPTGDDPIISLDDPRVTDEQRAAAQSLIDRTTEGMEQFPNEDSLIAAGYTTIGDAGTGFEHYVNWSLLGDSKELDETAIESVVLQVAPDGTKTVASAMYILSIGKTMSDVPDIAGELTTWHDHTNLCFNGTRVVALAEDGSCPPGSTLLATPPMLHVWMVPFACGPFGGIETSGHGGGCDPDDHDH